MYNIRKQIQEILDSDYNTQEKIKIKGEVFTPWQLIKEMLDKLPNQIWTNPNKTWLDPAAGLGNFHCVVVERLMVGLSEFEPNEEKRYRHIIENQLYFIELNSESAKLIKKIFNPDKKYKLNLVCADALDANHPGWNEVGYMWDEDDIGNPNVRRKEKELQEKKRLELRTIKEREVVEGELKEAEIEKTAMKSKRSGEKENPNYYDPNYKRKYSNPKYKNIESK